MRSLLGAHAAPRRGAAAAAAAFYNLIVRPLLARRTGYVIGYFGRVNGHFVWPWIEQTQWLFASSNHFVAYVMLGKVVCSKIVCMVWLCGYRIISLLV